MDGTPTSRVTTRVTTRVGGAVNKCANLRKGNGNSTIVESDRAIR